MAARKTLALSLPVIFAQQVMGYGKKENVLIGLSTSGNARNVALALKTASEELRKALLACITKRAAETVAEEMSFMGPLRLREIEVFGSVIPEPSTVLLLAAAGLPLLRRRRR